MLTFDDLVAGFHASGVEAGDTLRPSSYKSLGLDGGPQTVVNAPRSPSSRNADHADLQLRLNKGQPWDVRFTLANGRLTELVRKDPREKVFHPIYSCHPRQHAELLGNLRYKSSYGAAGLRQTATDGKIMVIGLSFNSMTFFHHVEQMEGVDYRFQAVPGEVTDWDGTTKMDTFEMLVRDIDRGVITEADPWAS
jgi:hypothetical protein